MRYRGDEDRIDATQLDADLVARHGARHAEADGSSKMPIMPDKDIWTPRSSDLQRRLIPRANVSAAAASGLPRHLYATDAILPPLRRRWGLRNTN